MCVKRMVGNVIGMTGSKSVRNVAYYIGFCAEEGWIVFDVCEHACKYSWYSISEEADNDDVSS